MSRANLRRDAILLALYDRGRMTRAELKACWQLAHDTIKQATLKLTRMRLIKVVGTRPNTVHPNQKQSAQNVYDLTAKGMKVARELRDQEETK